MVGHWPFALALCLCAASSAWSAPLQYAFGRIARLEMSAEPYWQSPREDKKQFDCVRFKVTPAQVAFALRHARQVSEQDWLDDDKTVSIGCHASIVAHFKNGDRVPIDLEPTGRIYARPENGRAAGQPLFFICRPCAEAVWFDDPLLPRSSRERR